jgi:hypothetical protein
MKTIIMACKKELLYVFFFFLPLCLFAQTGDREVVAVIPFWGPDERTQVEFAEEVLNGINRLSGYRSTLIDMTNIPEDVPEGGYEPNVCPSPSLTRGLPYAMTGELTEDYDTGGWALRVYLWRMEGTRLIYSDRLVAYDRETCRLILPGLLDWIFSFLEEPESPFMLAGAGGAGEGAGVTQVRYYAPEEPKHWLYTGVRAGGSMKLLADPDDSFSQYHPDGKPPFPMTVVNTALSFAWMFPDNAIFASPFGLQAEVLFDWDLDDNFNYISLSLAGILRTHLYRKGTAAITLLPGLYWTPQHLIKKAENAEFEKVMVTSKGQYPGGAGVTVGFSAGNKFGAGYLYLELRWMGDFLVNTLDTVTLSGFKRHTFGLCIGYEFGIIAR